jgi:hypothetical protein
MKIVLGSKCLIDWNQTNLLLAESMLRFCDYGAGFPDNIVGTDQTEALRQRFVKLRRHIERALLREARMDEALKQEGRSNIQWVYTRTLSAESLTLFEDVIWTLCGTGQSRSRLSCWNLGSELNM